jgi:hypothetical protein
MPSAIDAVLGVGGLASEFRRMEEAQKVWLQGLNGAGTSTDQWRDFAASNSMAAQAAKQFNRNPGSSKTYINQ